MPFQGIFSKDVFLFEKEAINLRVRRRNTGGEGIEEGKGIDCNCVLIKMFLFVFFLETKGGRVAS